jgi:hypothetical protein
MFNLSISRMASTQLRSPHWQEITCCPNRMKEIEMSNTSKKVIALAILPQLAVVFLTPTMALAQTKTACAPDSNQVDEFIECDAVPKIRGTAKSVAPAASSGMKASIGDFIDETREEQRQRSSQSKIN